MGPIRAMLTDAGITEQQWRVLRVLDENGACDATEVATEACLLMPSLTRILQILEEKGYCSRTKHPTDRRRALIVITNEGRAIIKQNAPEAGRIFAEIVDDIGAEKFETLMELLNDLVDPSET